MWINNKKCFDEKVHVIIQSKAHSNKRFASSHSNSRVKFRISEKIIEKHINITAKKCEFRAESAKEIKSLDETIKLVLGLKAQLPSKSFENGEIALRSSYRI